MNLRGDDIHKADFGKWAQRSRRLVCPNDEPAPSALSRVLLTVEILEFDVCIGGSTMLLHARAYSVHCLSQAPISRLSICMSGVRRFSTDPPRVGPPMPPSGPLSSMWANASWLTPTISRIRSLAAAVAYYAWRYNVRTGTLANATMSR